MRRRGRGRGERGGGWEVGGGGIEWDWADGCVCYRLRTRMAFVRVREESLEEKRMHCGFLVVPCFLSFFVLRAVMGGYG